MITRGRLAAMAVALSSLLAPATADAASIGVENGAIRYVGDSGDNELIVWPAESGEHPFEVAGGTLLGTGCHKRAPGDEGHGSVLCSLSGVSRIEILGGDGNDFYGGGSAEATDLPVLADMGAGDDRFEWGGAGLDFVVLGDGSDFAMDGPGDDHVEGGDGDDSMVGNFFEGSDTLVGGNGNDNLDGYLGDDTLIGGPGDDILQPSDGNDTLDAGPGSDFVGCDDPGDDTVDAGPGADHVCGGFGMDTVDAGAGDDSVSSFDNQLDGLVSCGAGSDVAWVDPFDPVGLDCEQQGQPQIIRLPAANVLPVRLPCAPGACAGKTRVFATPNAPKPGLHGPPPHVRPTAVGKALAEKKFKLRAKAKRTLRLKLSKAASKRLKKLGRTTVEARTVFTQRGKRYSVRRTFQVKPR
jgi:Ca2+-binding RTX toxin-like protein